MTLELSRDARNAAPLEGYCRYGSRYRADYWISRAHVSPKLPPVGKLAQFPFLDWVAWLGNGHVRRTYLYSCGLRGLERLSPNFSSTGRAEARR